MFFYFFLFFIIFYKFDITGLYIYLYVIYLLTLFYYSNFLSLCFLKTDVVYKQQKINFKKLILLVQVSIKNYKCVLFWKPLFKKISYFGFYRNSINNNISKK